jgi:hypothetical protein
MRRSPFIDFSSGIMALRVLRGYSKMPKGLKLSMYVEGKLEGTWAVEAVAPPERAILDAERKRRG